MMTLEQRAQKMSDETGMHFIAALRHLRDLEYLRNQYRPFVGYALRQYDASMIEVVS